MYELDFQRRFDRVGMYVSWITTVALAATLTLDQYGSNHELTQWKYDTFMGACALIALGYTAQLIVSRRTGSSGALVLSPVAATLQLALSIAGLTALSSATGGITRPYWLFFIMVMIPAAITLPVKVSDPIITSSAISPIWNRVTGAVPT